MADSGGLYNTSYTYDKQGNIKSLTRHGKSSAHASDNVVLDELGMTYSGNQLLKVTDAGIKGGLSETGDFKDYSNGSGVYQYNKIGALIKDTDYVGNKIYEENKNK